MWVSFRTRKEQKVIWEQYDPRTRVKAKVGKTQNASSLPRFVHIYCFNKFFKFLSSWWVMSDDAPFTRFPAVFTDRRWSWASAGFFIESERICTKQSLSGTTRTLRHDNGCKTTSLHRCAAIDMVLSLQLCNILRKQNSDHTSIPEGIAMYFLLFSSQQEFKQLFGCWIKH